MAVTFENPRTRGGGGQFLVQIFQRQTEQGQKRLRHRVSAVRERRLKIEIIYIV
jgi:hypothetical protein